MNLTNTVAHYITSLVCLKFKGCDQSLSPVPTLTVNWPVNLPFEGKYCVIVFQPLFGFLTDVIVLCVLSPGRVMFLECSSNHIMLLFVTFSLQPYLLLVPALPLYDWNIFFLCPCFPRTESDSSFGALCKYSFIQ